MHPTNLNDSPSRLLFRRKNKIWAGIALAVVMSIAAGWLAPKNDVKVSTYGFPKVIRTQGGTFEIVALQVNEIFTKIDPSFLRGTTVSEVRVPAVFRYHIEMAQEWPITVDGKTIIVRTGPVKPTLPVAIKTEEMEKSTRSGWARFNKHDNLAALEQAITPQLNARSEVPDKLQMARDQGRVTVREFVKTWMAKETQGKLGSNYQIKVIFPGDIESPAGL